MILYITISLIITLIIIATIHYMIHINTLPAR